MHKLEPQIAAWRDAMGRTPGMGRETLDELESHLRDTLDALLRSGLPETEAFQRAVAQLGASPAIAAEFRKIEPRPWLPVQVAVGAGVAAALILGAFLAARVAGGSNVLLAGHFFALTLGYVTVLLTGALGICFVCQRSVAGFSPSRAQSLVRVTFTFAVAAAGLTAMGILLGALWAEAEWGRFWAWDPKETAALGVLAWTGLFLGAHRWRGITAHGVFLLSLVGNVVVSLAWLGPFWWASLHSYGQSTQPTLLIMVIFANLLCLFVGLAPAGWLRTGKASSPANP